MTQYIIFCERPGDQCAGLPLWRGEYEESRRSRPTSWYKDD